MTTACDEPEKATRMKLVGGSLSSSEVKIGY